MDWESDDVAWVAQEEIAERELLPAFADAWPTIRRLLQARPLLVVDAANVVGSVPDGWWRDRAGAATRLLASIRSASRGGFPAAWFALEGAVLAWPRIVVVLEGAARGACEPATDDTAPTHRPAFRTPQVLRAERDGDTAVADLLGGLPPLEREHAALVTADRGLRARTAGTRHLGPGTFRSALRTLEG